MNKHVGTDDFHTRWGIDDDISDRRAAWPDRKLICINHEPPRVAQSLSLAPDDSVNDLRPDNFGVFAASVDPRYERARFGCLADGTVVSPVVENDHTVDTLDPQVPNQRVDNVVLIPNCRNRDNRRRWPRR